MQYYLGIDGGGTKTRCLLVDSEDRIVDSLTVGSTNHHNIGAEPAGRVLADIMDYFSCWELGGVCFAGAGVDVQRDVTLYRELLRVPEGVPLCVCPDGLAALVGANGGLTGGVIIAGTGSIALGVLPGGGLCRVGGFGHKVDDGGSGYAIARDGIRAALLAHDGRGLWTAILPRLLDELGIQDPLDIVDFLYNHDTTPQDIARLCRCVTDLAGKDAVADGILAAAAQELFLLAQGLTLRLCRADFPLGLAGGVLENVPAVRQRVIEKIRASFPAVDAHLPVKDPAQGAALLARMQPLGDLLPR